MITKTMQKFDQILKRALLVRHSLTLSTRATTSPASERAPLLRCPGSVGHESLKFNHPGLQNLAARGMLFNVCRGTLGSLAMFTAIRNAYHLGRQENEYRSPGARLA